MAQLTSILLLVVLCALTASYEARAVKKSPTALEHNTNFAKIKRILQKLEIKEEISESPDSPESPDYGNYSDYGSGDYDYDGDEILDDFLTEAGVDKDCVYAAIDPAVADLDQLLLCEGVRGVVIDMMGYAIGLMSHLPDIIEGTVWETVFKPGGILETVMMGEMGGAESSVEDRRLDSRSEESIEARNFSARSSSGEDKRVVDSLLEVLKRFTERNLH